MGFLKVVKATLKNPRLPNVCLAASFVCGSHLAFAGGEEAEAGYDVRLEKSHFISMRDEVRLSTDLYFPEGAKGKLPVILMRTPYNKNNMRRFPPVHKFVEQGYVVAIQDVRGKFESYGEFIPQNGDVNDGYDTIEWISTQFWSNGRVGSIGCSYLGDVQIFMAQSKHPALKAVVPQSSAGSVGAGGNHYSYGGSVSGGAIVLSGNLGWYHDYGSKVYNRLPEDLTREEFLELVDFFDPAPKTPKIDYSSLWDTLPLSNLMKAAGSPPNDFNALFERDLDDPWWDQFHYLKGDETFDVPGLFINSWHDFGISESLYQFNLFQKNALSKRSRDNQFVIISPMNHCESGTRLQTENTIVGERDMGDARLDYANIYMKWFDYWLKGDKNATIEMPKVQYYLMGKNEWKSAPAWPLPNTQYRKFYFHSNGNAQSRLGDGTLDFEAPAEEPVDNYTYDPADPTPSLGGSMCCTGTNESVAGSFDQSEIELRKDMLVYTSEPMEKGVEVTGPMRAVLYVSSSAMDTDFTVKLIDVYPDGRAYNMQQAILRARYREGFDKKVFMKEGEVYEVNITIPPTSNFFAPGHRIRIEIASSDFPAFDRNLNTGGNNYDETEWVVASNALYHSEKYPSHIVLPVIPE